MWRSLFTTYTGHCRQLGQYKTQDPGLRSTFSARFRISPSAPEAEGGYEIWDPVKAKEEAGSAADMEERFAKRRGMRST